MDEPIITEHGGNRDEQSGHGGDQGGGNARSHGGHGRRALLGDAGERAHDAPNGSEQSQKRRAAHGDGQQNKAGLEFERFLGDDVFNGNSLRSSGLMWKEVKRKEEMGSSSSGPKIETHEKSGGWL